MQQNGERSRGGRCRKGERLIGRVPYGHWKTTIFVAGLRCDAIVVPCVIDGPMTGEILLAYVGQSIGADSHARRHRVHG